MTDRLDRIEAVLEQTVQQQQQLTTRLDSLVFETQRLFNRLGEQQSRTDAAIESLSASVARLTQNSEADRVRFRETQVEIRQIWEYLLRQRGNGRGEA